MTGGSVEEAATDGPLFDGASWLVYMNGMGKTPERAWMFLEDGQCKFTTHDQNCAADDCIGTCEIGEDTISWNFGAPNSTSDTMVFLKGAGCWGPYMPSTDQKYAYVDELDGSSVSWLWQGSLEAPSPVSYTHLTLPTICSV